MLKLILLAASMLQGDPVYPNPQGVLVPTPAAVPAVPAPVATDPGLAWVNFIRSRHGLRPIAHDPAMASIAATNNAHQRAKGLGHHVRGDRRQNAGYGSMPQVQSMWMASPAHSAALLDPTITHGAFVHDGYYGTFSGR